MKLTLRYSWLCLCLFCCCCWFGCAARYSANNADKTLQYQGGNDVWVVKGTLLPGFSVADFPSADASPIGVSYNFTEVSFPGINTGNLFFVYRVHSQKQCTDLIEQL